MAEPADGEGGGLMPWGRQLLWLCQLTVKKGGLAPGGRQLLWLCQLMVKEEG